MVAAVCDPGKRKQESRERMIDGTSVLLSILSRGESKPNTKHFFFVGHHRKHSIYIYNLSCLGSTGGRSLECYVSMEQMTVVQAAGRARPAAPDEGLGCPKLWTRPSRVTLPLQEKSRGKWLC